MSTYSQTMPPVPTKRRQTKAQQHVLNLIRSQVGAITPGDLEKQLKFFMNRVTIYRALQVLLKEGQVGRLADGKCRVLLLCPNGGRSGSSAVLL